MPETYSFLTAEQIATPARSEAINSTTSSLTAVQDTQFTEWIETLNARFVRAAHIKHTAGGWSWMRPPPDNFNTFAKTTLNGALSAGGASVVLTSATNFDSSGRIAIETSKGAVDFVDYSSKSSNTLTVSTATGADPIDIAHSSGERVEKLYALPSNYAKTIHLVMNDDVIFLPLRDVALFPNWHYYTQIGAYILFPRDIGAQDFTHYYEKKAATITALADTTDIPTMAQRWAIEMTLLHLFRIRRKRSDIVLSQQLADIEMQEMIQYDQTFTTRNTSLGIRTGTFRNSNLR